MGPDDSSARQREGAVSEIELDDSVTLYGIEDWTEVCDAPVLEFVPNPADLTPSRCATVMPLSRSPRPPRTAASQFSRLVERADRRPVTAPPPSSPLGHQPAQRPRSAPSPAPGPSPGRGSARAGPAPTSVTTARRKATRATSARRRLRHARGVRRARGRAASDPLGQHRPRASAGFAARTTWACPRSARTADAGRMAVSGYPARSRRISAAAAAAAVPSTVGPARKSSTARISVAARPYCIATR